MVVRRLVIVVLAALLCACGQHEPIDLEALEGQARGGDAAAAARLVELLAVSENHLNARVYKIVLELGPQVVPALLEAVASPDTEQREHVIAALGTLGAKAAVEPLGRVLGDPALGRRYVAAWALGEIGSTDAVPVLIGALEDDNAEVRRFATRALIKLNQAAVEPLIAYLGRAGQEGEAAAVRALGDIGDLRALPALLGLAGGSNRGEVFLALGKLKDARAQQALAAGLADEDWRVRMNAAMALGPLGGAEVAPALERSLEDEVHVVREWSARSLEMITGRHVTYRNEKGEYVAPYNIYH